MVGWNVCMNCVVVCCELDVGRVVWGLVLCVCCWNKYCVCLCGGGFIVVCVCFCCLGNSVCWLVV